MINAGVTTSRVKSTQITRDLFMVRPHPVLMPTKVALLPESNYKGRKIGRLYAAPNTIEGYLKDPEYGSKGPRKNNFGNFCVN